MKKIFISITRIFIFFIIFIFIFFKFFSNSFIFHELPYPLGEWEILSYQGVEEYYFYSADEKTLNGLFLNGKKDYPLILFCHGNLGNVTYYFGQAKLLQLQGYSVFLFDYRGYGKSQGSPSEIGCYLDVLGAYDFILKEKSILPSNVVVFGTSLGGAIAIELAKQRKVKALIVESSFTSIKDLSKDVLGFTLPCFLPCEFRSIDKIKNIYYPTLIIHSKEDKLIPIEHGKRLFNASNGKEKKFFCSVGEHGSVYIFGKEDYYKKIKNFISSIK